MVAVSLTGVTALGLMTLMADYSEHVARRENESNLTEQLVNFTDSLDITFGNASLLESCGCGNGCIYSETAPAQDCTYTTLPTPGGCDNSRIVRFEYEDSGDPSIASVGNCDLAGVTPAGSMDGVILRGCKRRAVLVYTPPVAAVPGPAAAGRLDLYPESVTGVRGPDPMFSLVGVTYLRCGHLPNTSGAATSPSNTSSIRFSIKAKSRANNYGPMSPSFDSWHPSDIAKGFDRGTHRAIVSDVNFRNLNTGGVFFGKTSTARNCKIDGLNDPVGNCCSGYWNSTSTTCLAAGACLPSGIPPAAANVASNPLECCSHNWVTDTKACI